MTKIVMLNKFQRVAGEGTTVIPKTSEEVNTEIEAIEKEGFFLSETFDPVSVLIFAKDVGE